jgi:hypothetical protein
MPYKDPEAKKANDRKWRKANQDRIRASGKRWREEHPDCRRQEWQRLKSDPARLNLKRVYCRIKKQELREKVIVFYGGKCECCSETVLVFLAMDHRNGKGKAHRDSFDSSDAYYRWLLQKRRPEFRVLCHNCNFAVWCLGKCPHQK